ncbi:MSCRAMM family protein [Caldisericum exile]|uniref:MSCRAMM family protein n=1 Tax=Caldisericum exile TaxID=693075 RepID=UPI0012EA5DAA|nr:carboxypeptidase regulatory-like domain-containing protein [Caldisericum exile]
MATSNNKAYVFVFSENQYETLYTVNLNSGRYTVTWREKYPKGIQNFNLDHCYSEFININNIPHLLFISENRNNFILQPFNENGPFGEQIILKGGQPVYADILIERTSLKTNPKKAICGSPLLIQGTAYNRGGQTANNVTAFFKIDDTNIGSLDLGNIQPFDSVSFAKIYNVSDTLTKDRINVEISLITNSKQFATKNDKETFMLDVLRKGVVFGRVSEGSGVTDPTWYTAGLEGVEVSFQGIKTYTDKNGFFTIENVEFGKGIIKFKKNSYNDVSFEIETTRTKPIVNASVRMNNHGRLKIIIQDEKGEKLSNVTVYLVDHEYQTDTDKNGEITFNIPKGTYRIAFKKAGYQAIPPSVYYVELSKEKTVTITLKELTTAILRGK